MKARKVTASIVIQARVHNTWARAATAEWWKWLGSWGVLQIELIRFAEGLDVGCEKDKKRIQGKFQ